MISIIVPVFNVKEYLIRCLDSLNAQAVRDFEVIVVDDGSTDGSGELADSYCTGKGVFHVFHKENGGLMDAWKYGLARANGEYIGFVDSDDYVSPEMYLEMSKCVEESHSDIVLCNHYYVSEDGSKRTLHRNPIQEGFYDGEKLEKIRPLMLPTAGKDYISPSRCTKLLRKDLLQACLKYTDNRITSAEDVNVMVPCLLSCRSFSYVNKPLYYYVKRSSSISYTFKDHILGTYLVLIDQLSRCMKDLGLDQKLQKEREGLFNLYGIAWSVYVFNSALPPAQKKKKLEEAVKEPAFQACAQQLTRSSGMTAWLYKQMMKFRSPSVFLIGKKLLGILK